MWWYDRAQREDTGDARVPDWLVKEWQFVEDHAPGHRSLVDVRPHRWAALLDDTNTMTAVQIARFIDLGIVREQQRRSENLRSLTQAQTAGGLRRMLANFKAVSDERGCYLVSFYADRSMFEREIHYQQAETRIVVGIDLDRP